MVASSVGGPPSLVSPQVSRGIVAHEARCPINYRVRLYLAQLSEPRDQRFVGYGGQVSVELALELVDRAARHVTDFHGQRVEQSRTAEGESVVAYRLNRRMSSARQGWDGTLPATADMHALWL